MKKIIASTLICSSLLLGANSNYNYEITPMIGGALPEGNLDLEDQQHYGISFGVNLNEKNIFDQVELGILRTTNTRYDISSEKTEINRFFVNMIKEYYETSRVSYYSLAGFGYEDFTNNQFNNDDDGFFNYGVGVKYKLTEQLALKADVRHLITFAGNNNLLYTLGLGISFGEKAQPHVKQKEEPKVEEKVVEEVKEEKPVIGDDDKDGVLNNVDKCPNTELGIVVDATGCAVSTNLSINFDFDSAEIKNTYGTKLEEFATFLKTYPMLNAKIGAHTDSVGSAAYNKKLSQKRAEAAVKSLTALNIDPSRLEAVGYGEEKPLSDNATKEGRALNRRVEAVVKQ